MKKTKAVLIIVVMLTALICYTYGINTPSNLTAQEVVQRYFYYWNAKKPAKMNKLLSKQLSKGTYELYLLNSIVLDSCSLDENFDKSDWYEPWYKNPYDCACVNTKFTIDAKAESALSSGTYFYKFYLIKKDNHSDWIIAMYGQG